MPFEVQENRLIRREEGETLCIEAWGENSLRVRAVRMGDPLEGGDWALCRRPAARAAVTVRGEEAEVVNGRLRAHVSADGRLTFYDLSGRRLLEEFVRNRRNHFAENCSALEIEGREFRAILGGDYTLTARFESDPREKLYGMGQYQQPFLNLKGCRLELAHRNSQASVPFLLSSAGYGFLWNNPAIGEVLFAKNVTEWRAQSAVRLDYWITAGDTPAQIEESYAAVAGTVPMMPEYGLGFWQSKLRYQTQEELLEVAREYKRRGLPLDVIVADFFHWTRQGDWKFDPACWPDPEGMTAELRAMGIELMVSVWPTVEAKSENFEEMRRRGFLVKTERGVPITLDCAAPTVFYDATNPGARAFLWEKAKANYYEKGVRLFWLDEAEPEYAVYDFDNYRYYLGTNLQIGNIYPVMYARTFYDGMRAEGQDQPVNLLRCAWAGSQRYGALVWSGDIASSFSSMRSQLAAGLNMGLAGIPWWTTDIGGFHGGDPRDDGFRELFARWFAWGAFCPVMRLHGDREPEQPREAVDGLTGGPNEVWSYGERVYGICCKYLKIRERLRDYTRQAMRQAHEKGTPVMRPLFYEFPEDPTAWEVEDAYLYGGGILVAPVCQAGVTGRRVYLPAGASWTEFETGRVYEGGVWVEADAPLEVIPVFLRDGLSF